MKKIALLIFSIPFFANAQLLPQLIPGYLHPGSQNEPLDPAYIPGKIYRVDFYALAANQSDLYLDQHFLIETDDSFKLQKKSNYVDNITEYTERTKYVTEYIYGNKLERVRYLSQKINTVVLELSAIDSFSYDNEMMTIRDRWNINNDSGTTKQSVGSEYIYDSLGRYTTYAPYNLNADTGIIYVGYYTVDSFTLSGKPARIRPFTVPVDSNHIEPNYTVIAYDHMNRVSGLARHMRFANDVPYFRADSVIYFYTGNKIYPDSMLRYSTGQTQNAAQKTIFTYTPAGTISEIDNYIRQGTGMILSNREVYTALSHSALKETDAALSFRLHPNPSEGKFTVSIPDVYSGSILSIINMLGAEVYTQSYVGSGDIDLAADLKPGIYALSITKGPVRLSKKIVIR